MFATKTNELTVWVTEDDVAFTLMYPEDYWRVVIGHHVTEAEQISRPLENQLKLGRYYGPVQRL